MITQIIIHLEDSTEDFTFSGSFPTKSQVIDYLELLKPTYPYSVYFFTKCLKVIKALKNKDWPILQKDGSILSSGSVEFGKDIWIMKHPIIWKILTPFEIPLVS